EHLENGDTELPAQLDGMEITLLAEFSQRERAMALSGGFRRQLRQQQGESAPEGGEFRHSDSASEQDAQQGGGMS
ncbi:MAG TPA: hypothetical protein VK359_05670, partial [Rubrobacteraceae bacterium]|nr:hypothetical protein [Rubrobacteraceae bacterium]